MRAPRSKLPGSSRGCSKTTSCPSQVKGWGSFRWRDWRSSALRMRSEGRPFFTDRSTATWAILLMFAFSRAEWAFFSMIQ